LLAKHKGLTEWGNPMPSSEVRLERVYACKEAFLALLSNSIANPTADWPTVRFWTKTSLNRLFKKIRAKLDKSKQPLSNSELLNWMNKLGLASAVEADGETFYLLEIGASPTSEIDPLELMMAYEPFGVICYFSAIAYHSLSSQVPSHHHVAVLTDSTRKRDANETGLGNADDGPREEMTVNTTSGGKRTRNKPNALGKVIFSYSGIPYHSTRRMRRLLPGVQNRSNGPRGRIRITTYEQTLLDTLHRPQNCGGPAVVLEAWQEASTSGRLDEERLLGYLNQMDYPSTTRRIGAMLQIMDYTSGAELKSYLDRAKRNIDRRSPYSQISLLPGFDYANLDEEWLVKSP
jgi:hypothetical protein